MSVTMGKLKIPRGKTVEKKEKVRPSSVSEREGESKCLLELVSA